MAYKPKAPPVMAAPNVIPMADIMLVLLIIFMVVTPMLQKGVSVDMAKVDKPRKCRTPTRMTRSSSPSPATARCYLGSTQIGLDEITTK